jgi:hypothetical protein
MAITLIAGDYKIHALRRSRLAESNGDKRIEKGQIRAFQLTAGAADLQRHPMTFLDGLWHWLGFAVPALAVGGLTAMLAKGLWRPAFRGISPYRLAAVCGAASVVGLAGATLWFGQDGRMAGYAIMVLCSAVTAWWYAKGSG